MVVDAVRTYFDAASGLTELSRKQAVAAAKTLLRANGPVAPVTGEGEGIPSRVGQSIQALAGELVETNRSNREALADLVRREVERQLESMDVVPRAEHERLVRRVAELERRLAARHAVERALGATGTGPSSPVGATAGLPNVTASLAKAAVGAGVEGTSEQVTATFEPTVERPGEDSEQAEKPGAEGTVAEGEDGRTGTDEGARDGTGKDAPAATEKKTSAKSRPRAAAKSPTKNARTRSGAKRTTKGKGAAKS
ncbi:membrane fusogenic activity family protein [Nocardiopsis sp. ATB16-24]|uniref:membrane fusogenic activity family protein n=1 Tax=Nocardiopsis sp. ATB16-24 TaxID=3019555 RepID=UPI00255237F4|nr:membrane fusogenic activity family protein [Nocardiopsis sp. ATB16-24]